MTWQGSVPKSELRAFALLSGAGAVLFAVMGILCADTPAEAAVLCLALLLFVWAAVFDFARGVIPIAVSTLLAVLSLAASFWSVPPSIPMRLLGLLLGAGIPLLARFLFLKRGRDALGLGDVAYLAAIGLISGGEGVLITLISGSLLTVLAGCILKRRTLPFAPALSLAAAAVLVLLI